MIGKTNAVGIFPKGKITITENATDIDVKKLCVGRCKCLVAELVEHIK